MKKSLFLMCVAAATLASCSQEDVLDVAANHGADNAINFRVRTLKATRGVDMVADDLQSFKVFGLKGSIDEYRDGTQSEPLTQWWGDAIEFKRSTVEGDDHEDYGRYFRSDIPMYYPTDYSFVTFLAYAPAELGGVSPVLDSSDPDEHGNLLISNYTVNPDINAQEDIIVDGGSSMRDEEYSSYDLTFKHALSKVFVSHVMNNDERYSYKVAGVRFGNIAMTGNGMYDPYGYSDSYSDYFKWTVAENPTDKAEYIFKEGVEIDGNTALMSNEGTDGSFLLIPQQLQYVTKEGIEDEGDGVHNLVCQEGVAYVGLLIRITEKNLKGEDEVVYPFAQGVANITETVNGEEYAWAIFPVSTNWLAGNYIDYQVDFSKGAGFVAPGAEGFMHPWGPQPGDEDYSEENDWWVKLEYTPILGSEIKFTVTILDWDLSNTDSTVQQDGDDHSKEVWQDGDSVEDPFGE